MHPPLVYKKERSFLKKERYIKIKGISFLKKGKELNVHVVPVYMNIDTENNYPLLCQPVNADNSQTILRANNGVHPAQAGYYQMGDTLYCYMKAILNNKK